MSAFPQNLHRIRTDAGLSQDELAAKLGFEGPARRQRISKWETGERAPSIKSLNAIASALEVPVGELLS